MAYEFLGQILAALIISGMFLIGPSVVVFYGWIEWQRKIYKRAIPVWRRVLVSIGVASVTAQTIVSSTLFITIFHFKVLVQHRFFFLSWCLFIELLLLLIAAPCMFAWQGRLRWWLLASSIYLPVVSFFFVLAVMAY